jgi:outer membrane protein
MVFTQIAHAENINEALARAYLSNPQLNAQRANTRGVDENLPIARGTFLPKVSAQGLFGVAQTDILNPFGKQRALTTPSGGALIVALEIFNGFRGINGIDQAKAQIYQSRQLLRNTELTVLGNAVTAYMNVLRDVAIYHLRDQYVSVLVNQVEITKERLRGGEVTRTDVYQAEAALAQAKQERATSVVNLQGSISVYRQQIGQAPKKLAPVAPLDRLLPKELVEATQLADAEHPLAVAARYNVDISQLSVNIAEGQLLPTVGLTGQVNQQYNYAGIAQQRYFQGGVNMTVNVPLYEGGIAYGQVRQAKEKLGEMKFIYDQQINQLHQVIEATWAAWKQSGVFLSAAKEQVKKAESALEGVREEATYGLRTTWDILNAQLTLVNARIAFVIGQRERVVSTYNLLAAMGQLSATSLGLDVPLYEPTDHYDRVKYQWIGTEPWK